MILDKIQSPQDIKKLSVEELAELSQEIRETLLTKLQKTGGHVGPNLGIVEVTVALHTVFDSPKDKIVYDISHQCYTHKILTGRKDGYTDPEKYKLYTGFTDPAESEHDLFSIGHTSTSVSLAYGLAKGRDLLGSDENVIALIGDGSLSGGEAYEGLNNAGAMNSNMIVIVNDNDQSIAENHGGIYGNLKALRESNGKASDNLFKAMGFEYRFIADGHNLEVLLDTFNSVKGTNKPVVIHIVTTKGKGYKPAETQREKFHYSGPFDFATGEALSSKKGESYSGNTVDYLLKKMKKDPAVAYITAGTPTVMGFTAEKRKEAGKQFIDVGIAEEQAIATASGMAKNKAKPVVAVSSTFLQRAYDQLQQDLCLNSSPAVILVCTASVYGMRDKTHLGIFDIPLLSPIPNLVYLAPTSSEEYFKMLEWAIEQDQHPVAIRVPTKEYISTGVQDNTDYGVINQYQVTQTGKDVAIVGLGDFYHLAKDVVVELEKQGLQPTLINPKFITGLDEQVLNDLQKDHQLVVTIEDGLLEGGFGEKIARFFGPTDMKVKNYGIKKGFPDRYNPEELLEENGISVNQIVETIQEIIK